MLFPTTDFAIFFAVAFTANWLLNPYPRVWKLAMVALSYFFYSWWDWRFVFLLAAETVVAQAGVAVIGRIEAPRPRRIALAVSLVALLSFLLWFKYYGFFALNVDNALHGLGGGRVLPLVRVTLPVGVSFFTFMAISYVVDVYRREIEPARPVDLAVYLSFFPHLVAGPIVRGQELLPQIRRRRDPRRIDFGRAAWLIAAGLFKKVVLSSYIASSIVDPVFAAPRQRSSLEILVAIYGYAVQIYADFSGYTDIAIGLALLLGFRFPDNFDAPYTARSLQDFWRRWHMTLSRWLRDYLYIPLGGNRGSRLLVARNIMITMLLGGLWHGAAWTFIAWGAIHGVGQVIGHENRQRRLAAGLEPLANGRGRVALQRFLTFQVVCLAWVFFRADSMATAFTLLGRLFTDWTAASPLVTPLVVLAVAFGIGVQYVPSDAVERLQRTFARFPVAAQGAILGVVLLAITTLGPQGVAPFIYYRF
ncbi:MAG TPA: MBOAT family O-acyltransferase [Acidimicrobiales bacterium]|nr:MBOAT family O-acyltransferase [Acidimicrobiales bacterium]